MFERQQGEIRFPYCYRAKVLDNADPDQLGRIKVEIYPLTANIIADDQPWCRPAFPLFDGSGDGTGSFCVPKVGSYVFVFLEMGDIYQPVYFAEAGNRLKGNPTERTTNYPKTKVLKSTGGFVFTINDETGEVKVTTAAGDVLDFKQNGDISITSVGKLVVNITGECDLTASKVLITSTDIELGGSTGASVLTTNTVIVAPNGPCTITPGTSSLTTKAV